MSSALKKLHTFHKSLQPYIHIFKEFRWQLKYLKFRKPEKGKRKGVMRVDGRAYHGGLTDRFKGAISWWHYCQVNGLEFKLFFVHPFKLSEYLVPNLYDWTIEEKDIPDGLFDTRIFYARGEKGQRLMRLRTKKNIWYYGNIDLGSTLAKTPYNDNWGTTFNYLFKPSPLLEKHLELCRKEIEPGYIAVQLRFQNLLGDKLEPIYRYIDTETERRTVLDKALDTIDEIHRLNPGKHILVTTDSNIFLAEASKLDYVRTVKGDITHVEFANGDNDHSQLKTFLDFFMIAEASKVYSIVIGDMYPSDFPVYAAKVGGVPFERITLP